MNVLKEYLHKQCGGRLRLVWAKHSGLIWPRVICEKCQTLWDDTSDASSAVRLPSAKERTEQNLFTVDEDKYLP